MNNKFIKKSSRKFNSQKQFIEKAKKIHGNKYDYSKVKYNHSKEKVINSLKILIYFWILIYATRSNNTD